MTCDNRCWNCRDDPLSQFIVAGSITSSPTVNTITYTFLLTKTASNMNRLIVRNFSQVSLYIFNKKLSWDSLAEKNWCSMSTHPILSLRRTKTNPSPKPKPNVTAKQQYYIVKAKKFALNKDNNADMTLMAISLVHSHSAVISQLANSSKLSMLPVLTFYSIWVHIHAL